MIEMSIQLQDGKEYEIVDRKARSTLAHLLGNVATTYAVSTEFSFVESSNDLLLVVAGKAYTTTLTAYEGYVLDPATVKVTMAGMDVTAKYYKSGVISIPAVTGELVIVAGAVKPEVANSTVYFDISNATVTETNATKIDDHYYDLPAGETLTATFKPIDNYEIRSVMVSTIPSQELPNDGVTYNEDGSVTVTVPNVAWVKVIVAAGAIYVPDTNVYKVKRTLTNIAKESETADTWTYNSGENQDGVYENVLTPVDGYEVLKTNVTVTMGGEDVTALAYNQAKSKVMITIVSGDVEITAKATPIESGDVPDTNVYKVKRTLTNIAKESETADTWTYNSGENQDGIYENVLTPADGYEVLKTNVTVTMGGEDVTALAYNQAKSKVMITIVSGDVEITAKATPIESGDVEST